MMENDFRALLAGDPAILALVSSRIYPATYPQAATDPCVRYQKVTGAVGLHMRGSDGLSEDLMQVDIRATSAASALAVKNAIIAKLHGFSGTEGTTRFQQIALRDEREGFEQPGTTAYYTRSLDIDCWSRQVT